MRRTLAVLCTAFCLFVAAAQSKADTCGVAGNLVANCGFETGDFTSWTLTGNDVPAAQDNLYGVEMGQDPDGNNPHGGSYQVFIGDLVANATTLAQNIATTAGSTYTISFWLAQDTPTVTPYSNEFSVLFGGSGLTQNGIGVEGYTKYSFTETATSASTALDLTLGNDVGYFLLDDISVVDNSAAAPTPEPSAWTLMLVGIMGGALVWKRDALFAGNNL